MELRDATTRADDPQRELVGDGLGPRCERAGEMLRVISVFDASTGDLSRTFRGKKALAQGHPLRRRCTRSSFWLPAHRQK
ncbi:hypothetical protein DIPPA_16834 [Diplonema papillatum]|nr:hypothetical protein DIPPA_16834 [Diplonema papillatum]